VTVSAGPVQLLGIDAASYEPHPLHSSERIWTETNCYVDLWIEVLHALGLDPLAACSFVLSAGFECDQWSFIKFPLEDLHELYGIEVNEIAVWRPIIDHVVEHLRSGRLLTVEADSWWLPDTRGTSYRSAHVKSSIVPESVDRAGRRLGYFHGAGYYELSGDDFDGIFAPPVLPPYVEDVKLAGMRSSRDGLVETVIELTHRHLSRRPESNPVEAMGEHITRDLGWLAAAGLERFHDYAFVTVRQFGSTAELAASFVEWLDANTSGGLAAGAARLRSAAETAKALQFGLARIARGRAYDPAPALDAMAEDWHEAIAAVAVRYG
jgi:Domain of unknown function (DUF1839)